MLFWTNKSAVVANAELVKKVMSFLSLDFTVISPLTVSTIEDVSNIALVDKTLPLSSASLTITSEGKNLLVSNINLAWSDAVKCVSSEKTPPFGYLWLGLL